MELFSMELKFQKKNILKVHLSQNVLKPSVSIWRLKPVVETQYVYNICIVKFENEKNFLTPLTCNNGTSADRVCLLQKSH